MYKIIAHRGYHNKNIKENTYLSIKKALNNNHIIGVEFDIHLTKDKKIVIIHDSYIERTSNGHGKVEDMNIIDIQKYNFGTNKFLQTIPTLYKILELNTNKILLIEIKCNNNEKEFAKTIEKYIPISKSNIYFISFNEKVLKHLKKSYQKGKLSVNSKDTKYNILLINKLFYRNVKTSKKVFIYTINTYKEFTNRNIYYICDNLDNILRNIK